MDWPLKSLRDSAHIIVTRMFQQEDGISQDTRMDVQGNKENTVKGSSGEGGDGDERS